MPFLLIIPVPKSAQDNASLDLLSYTEYAVIIQFYIPVWHYVVYIHFVLRLLLFFKIIFQCIKEVLQHVTVTVLCNGTDVYSSITYLIQHINDITGLLSVPQYQQCNISIVFSNDAGSSEPLVLLIGKLSMSR